MSTKEITVLMVELGQHPKVTTLKDDLDSQQNAVSRVLEGCVEKKGMNTGFCKICKSGFWAVGRRVVDQKRVKHRSLPVDRCKDWFT